MSEIQKFVKQEEKISHTVHYLQVVREVLASAQRLYGHGVRLSSLPESEKFELWRKAIAQYQFENSAGRIKMAEAKRLVDKTEREYLISRGIGVFSYNSFRGKIRNWSCNIAA